MSQSFQNQNISNSQKRQLVVMILLTAISVLSSGCSKAPDNTQQSFSQSTLPETPIQRNEEAKDKKVTETQANLMMVGPKAKTFLRFQAPDDWTDSDRVLLTSMQKWDGNAEISSAVDDNQRVLKELRLYADQ